MEDLFITLINGGDALTREYIGFSRIAIPALAAILLLTVLPDVLFPDRPEPKKQEDT